MYIDDLITDLTLMMNSLEQQGQQDTLKYMELEKQRELLVDVVNQRQEVSSMFTIPAGLPHVMGRLHELDMLSVLDNKYSTYTLYDHFKYCETDDEYLVVYQELVQGGSHGRESCRCVNET